MGYDPAGTLDWGAIGRFIGGVALSIVGAASMITSLPIALTAPDGGFTTQAGFSAMMYGGFMVGSAFDSTIKADIDAIGWNPFNSNEGLVIGSDKVSFYKGMPTVWTHHSNGRSGSFLGIWLTEDPDVNTVRHEWGHGVQQGTLGLFKFALFIGLPSWKNWGGNHWQGNKNYYRRPWEAMADIFGGAATDRSKYNSPTAQDRTTAIWYTVIAALSGPVAFFLLF